MPNLSREMVQKLQANLAALQSLPPSADPQEQHQIDYLILETQARIAQAKEVLCH